MVKEMTNIFVDIVDDDDSSAELIRILLKKNGVQDFRIFLDPREFLESKEVVHICILDYRFPGMLDGFDVTEELMKRNKRCRILIITLGPNFKDFMKVYNAGAWKYLDKSDRDFDSDMVKYVKLGIEMVREENELLDNIKKRFNRDA